MLFNLHHDSIESLRVFPYGVYSLLKLIDSISVKKI